MTAPREITTRTRTTTTTSTRTTTRRKTTTTTTSRPKNNPTQQHQNEQKNTTRTRTRAKITRRGTPRHVDPMVIVACPGGPATVAVTMIDKGGRREAGPC